MMGSVGLGGGCLASLEAFDKAFHSFCVSVLQEDANAVQYPESFLVLDNSDIDAMLRIIYEERDLTLRHMTFSNARDMIEIRKLFEDPEYKNCIHNPH